MERRLKSSLGKVEMSIEFYVFSMFHRFLMFFWICDGHIFVLETFFLWLFCLLTVVQQFASCLLRDFTTQSIPSEAPWTEDVERFLASRKARLGRRWPFPVATKTQTSARWMKGRALRKILRPAEDI